MLLTIKKNKKTVVEYEYFQILFLFFSWFFSILLHFFYSYVFEKFCTDICCVFSFNIFSMKCDRFFRCIQHVLS